MEFLNLDQNVGNSEIFSSLDPVATNNFKPSNIILNELYKMIEKNKDDYTTPISSNIALNFLKNTSLAYQDYKPFVNGYFYIHMQSGSWINYYNPDKISNNVSNLTTININYERLKLIEKKSGKYMFNAELPNIMLESETVSGRLRNINYATKMQLTSDYSVTYHDTDNLEFFTYHSAWMKFIELLRRGDISLYPQDSNFNPTSQFVDVPYYNAMWVLVFLPFSVKPIAIFKMMGVIPINVPFSPLLGDRGAPTIGLFNQSYKCNDILFDLKAENEIDNFIDNQFNSGNSLYNSLLDEFAKVIS